MGFDLASERYTVNECVAPKARQRSVWALQQN